MRNACISLAFLSFLLNMCCGAEKSETFPVEIIGKVVFISGSINGAGPYKFILDTGATETLITPPVATKLGIKSMPVSENQKRSRVSSVSVGSMVVSNLSVYVFDPPQAIPLRLDHGANYSGILGHTFLSQFVITIDYGKSKVTMCPSRYFKEDEKIAGDPVSARIPLESRENMLFANFSVNGKTPMRFLVDTGSSEVLLTPSAARTLKLDVKPFETDPQTATTILTSLAAGNCKVDSIRAIVHQLPQDSAVSVAYDGIVGYPFLSNYTVTINYRDKYLGLSSGKTSRVNAPVQ